ncbi:MAG TPA: VWA domain-containing protein [Acidobacteriaceae bacterium]|jgi:VWFA-related protein|nr:VWA domain-containing protein [Acidobacteriaceae bacterium]
MLIGKHLCLLSAALLTGVVAAPAQQAPPASDPIPRSIHLNIAVTTKSGAPVADLTQQDFTLMDNGAAEPITSFKAVTVGQEPVEVILLLDAANAPFSTMAWERQQVQNFLKANGGKMAHPTTIAVLTDKGAQIQNGFSVDGNVLNDVFERYTSGLREINRGSGFWGATERLEISLKALHDLAAFTAKLPGRKVILWISPGWPLLSGDRTQINDKEQSQIFGQIVSFSGQLRLANTTLYDVDPRGAGAAVLHADYYREFLKGIRKPDQTVLGNLGLQVLALQSGGKVVESNNAVAEMLNQCLSDVDSWYEINFHMAPAEKPNEYHHVEVKVDKSGLIARTRDGYYAQPEARP